MAPSGMFKTADSAVVFSVLEHQWQAFCSFFDIAALARDPRFARNADRLANRPALMAILRPLFSATTTQDVLRRLRACDVPCAPVNDYAAVAADPQVVLNAMLEKVPHPVLGLVPFIRNPLRLQGIEANRGDVPLLGEHTEAVLGTLSRTPAQIDALRKAGVIL
jgi:crotonobetainyl-CoA:carnitine CoA-transferase CaiB-like acyl-CoA transferase